MRSAASMGGARARPHRAILCTLHRSVTQAGGYADMERHVLELYIAVRVAEKAQLVERCTVLDVVSKTAHCDHPVDALMFETFGCLGKEGTILIRVLVTAASANGLVK